jgi:hypothetical protein
MIVGDTNLGTQAFQRVTTVERQLQNVGNIAARAPRQTFDQEARAPAPLRRVSTQTKQQRRILASQPVEYL